MRDRPHPAGTHLDAEQLPPKAAGQAGLELRRLAGEQEFAWTYTLPLARGLR